MEILWGVVFLAATLGSFVWAWRRAYASLVLRGWPSIPSHCVGAVVGAFAAVVGVFAVAMLGAPGIDLYGRLLILPCVAGIGWAFWRLTPLKIPSRRGTMNARPEAGGLGAGLPTVAGATTAVSTAGGSSMAATEHGDSTAAVSKMVSRVAPRSARLVSNADDRRQDIVNKTFAFTYRKQNGTETRRTVRVERHGLDGSLRYVEGYCSEAHASRSFRLDRVRGRVTDMETGELISTQEMYRRLGPPSKWLDVKSFSAKANATRTARRPGWRIAVFFAGFGANQYHELATLAEAAGMDVRGSISRTVDYVVTGSLVGRQQLAKAESHGIAVIDEDTFRGMV